MNPSKSDLGKVIKTKLEKINLALVKHLDVYHWIILSTAVECSKGIYNRKDCIFIECDVREFYPSITESILKKEHFICKIMPSVFR